MKNDRASNRSSTAKRASESRASAESGNQSSGTIRPDGREPASDSRADSSIRTESSSNEFSSPSNVRSSQFASLPDGHYFTPSGTVERIPSGYTIRSDGRLSKQRKRRGNGDTRSSDGDNDTNRTETSETEKFSTEVPLWVGTTKRKKKITEAQQRLTLVAMLSVASTALFSSVSIFAGKHWQLELEESKILAENLNEALATLPSKTYEQVIAVIEKWVPWINLTFTIGAIAIPRIEESIKRYKESNNPIMQGSNRRDGRTENYSEFDKSSLGWNG